MKPKPAAVSGVPVRFRHPHPLVLLSALLLAMGILPQARANQAPPSANHLEHCGSLVSFLGKVNERALAVAGERKIRLAVIPIQQTESQRFNDKGFGAFLTEKISSSLVSPNSPIRLYERSRLDAVLQEQKLSSSGLFSESEARKIGELAPIDDILTGTFTRLEKCISINLRIIDVVSGEVRGHLSENVELTPDLAFLFQDLQAQPSASKGAAVSPCEPRWAPIRTLMDDIGTDQKLDRLVDAAVAIPFDKTCGDIHFQIIDHLMRYKRYPSRYGKFLLQTLQGIEDPDGDDRDRQISRYLLVPGQLDDPAWNAVLRLAERSKQFPAYKEFLLADKVGTDPSRERLNARIGVLLVKADQKLLGRPVPIEAPKLFSEIFSGLQRTTPGSGGAKDLRSLMTCYRVYGPKYAANSDKRVLEVLVTMHGACAPGKDREQILGWIGDRVAHFTPSRELEDAIVPLVEKLLEERTKARKTDSSGGSAAKDLKRLASLCGDRLAQTIPFVIGRGYRLNLMGFCLENGIRAEGVVPTLEALIQRLSGEDETDQQEAIRLLKAVGPGAIGAEPLVLKKLRRMDHLGSWSRNKYLQRDLLELLGTMQTHSPEAIQILVIQIRDQETYTSDAAIEALVRVGEPSAAALEAEFPNLEEPYKQIRILKIFRLWGHAARPHLPWLRARLADTQSPLVKDALEDTIEAISQ